MFSNLSSFLPGNLTFSSAKDALLFNNNHVNHIHHSDLDIKRDITRVDREPNQTTEQPKESLADDTGPKKKREKAHENFIVVRPPPAVSNHPLNLQLQLVPPHARQSRHSVDFSVPTEISDPNVSQDGVRLDRTISVRSNRSDVSMYSSISSTTSIASYASTTSTGTGRRMIIPLYNLSAHNVMTNTILDAGTDAKVAKFLKRGIEIIGLAVLDPMEVWGNMGSLEDVRRNEAVAAHIQRPSTFSGEGSPEPHTPTSSALSLSSSDFHPPTPNTPTPSNPTGNPSGPKKLFGKLFRKKDNNGNGMVSVPSSPVAPRSSVTLSVPQTTPRARKISNSDSSPPAVLQPPVLGIHPVLISASVPPTGRPSKYVWVVTKWLKGNQDSLIGGIKGMLMDDRNSFKEGSEVDVRFEWVRGKGHRRQTTQQSGHAVSNAQLPSQTSFSTQGRHSPTEQKTAGLTQPRTSMDSRRSPSPRPRSVQESVSEDVHEKRRVTRTQTQDFDDGEESDPEDSETPWSCSLIISPKPINSQMSSPTHSRSPSRVTFEHAITPPHLRLKIATLSPAPHHPKVVAQMKVPYPLPDIEVDHVRVRKRVITESGIARPAPLSGKEAKTEGLVLSAEEIKDVLSSTALWLVVREAFGGIGKVNRKGDGWRIRA